MNFKVLHAPKPITLSQFGGSALGHKFAVTNQYVTRDGKPYIYRMGEMHFSRIDERDWETELRKMKEGGIDIVASYLFWIHHEEVEGEFNFSGNRNLKKFCQICRRVGMPMFLRMGPWAHGEARNGGFPDWLLEKCGGKEHTRCNEQPYLDYAKRFYARVYEEVKDCMDTFVGIQIENELHRNPHHMATLREYANELGFRAPIWTATGWGPAGSGVSLPNNSVIPVYGAYPEAPWKQNLEPMEENTAYLFSPDWDQCGDIGTDIFEESASDSEDEPTVKISNYPYLTCELGGGIQVSYHRRPRIRSIDISAMVITRLGSGCNGLGYYMYHGGKNPIGTHTRMMQECRVTGYKNDYATISYDFQAPLGDCGQLRQSYFDLQAIHQFLEVSGEKLATMPAFFPTTLPNDPFDKNTLRCAVRSDGNSGYLFFNNYSRLCPMKNLQDTVCIELPNGDSVKIPLKIPADTYGIIPFRFAIGDEVAEWISAVPIEMDEKHLILREIEGVFPQICLRNGQIFNLNEKMEIGGIEVSLVKPIKINQEKESKISLHKNQSRLPDTIFEHIQNIGWQPLNPLVTEDYSFTLPENTKYLRICACGNAAAIFYKGEILSDFYLYGDDWIVDVRDVAVGDELIIKILPFDAENKSLVYLEYDMPLGHTKPEVYAIPSDIPTVNVNEK